MPVKLENLIAIGIGVVICGSIAPEVLAPIKMTVSRFYHKNTSQKILIPIENVISKGYDNVKIAGEQIQKLVYLNNPSLY